jgi:hypothetical protein
MEQKVEVKKEYLRRLYAQAEQDILRENLNRDFFEINHLEGQRIKFREVLLQNNTLTYVPLFNGQALCLAQLFKQLIFFLNHLNPKLAFLSTLKKEPLWLEIIKLETNSSEAPGLLKDGNAAPQTFWCRQEIIKDFKQWPHLEEIQHFLLDKLVQFQNQGKHQVKTFGGNTEHILERFIPSEEKVDQPSSEEENDGNFSDVSVDLRTADLCHLFSTAYPRRLKVDNKGVLGPIRHKPFEGALGRIKKLLERPEQCDPDLVEHYNLNKAIYDEFYFLSNAWTSLVDFWINTRINLDKLANPCPTLEDLIQRDVSSLHLQGDELIALRQAIWRKIRDSQPDLQQEYNDKIKFISYYVDEEISRLFKESPIVLHYYYSPLKRNYSTWQASYQPHIGASPTLDALDQALHDYAEVCFGCSFEERLGKFNKICFLFEQIQNDQMWFYSDHQLDEQTLRQMRMALETENMLLSDVMLYMANKKNEPLPLYPIRCQLPVSKPNLEQQIKQYISKLHLQPNELIALRQAIWRKISEHRQDPPAQNDDEIKAVDQEISRLFNESRMVLHYYHSPLKRNYNFWQTSYQPHIGSSPTLDALDKTLHDYAEVCFRCSFEERLIKFSKVYLLFEQIQKKHMWSTHQLIGKQTFNQMITALEAERMLLCDVKLYMAEGKNERLPLYPLSCQFPVSQPSFGQQIKQHWKSAALGGVLFIGACILLVSTFGVSAGGIALGVQVLLLIGAPGVIGAGVGVKASKNSRNQLEHQLRQDIDSGLPNTKETIFATTPGIEKIDPSLPPPVQLESKDLLEDGISTKNSGADIPTSPNRSRLSDGGSERESRSGGSSPHSTSRSASPEPNSDPESKGFELPPPRSSTMAAIRSRSMSEGAFPSSSSDEDITKRRLRPAPARQPASSNSRRVVKMSDMSIDSSPEVPNSTFVSPLTDRMSTSNTSSDRSSGSDTPLPLPPPAIGPKTCYSSDGSQHSESDNDSQPSAPQRLRRSLTWSPSSGYTRNKNLLSEHSDQTQIQVPSLQRPR